MPSQEPWIKRNLGLRRKIHWSNRRYIVMIVLIWKVPLKVSAFLPFCPRFLLSVSHTYPPPSIGTKQEPVAWHHICCILLCRRMYAINYRQIKMLGHILSTCIVRLKIRCKTMIYGVHLAGVNVCSSVGADRAVALGDSPVPPPLAGAV